MIKTTQTWEIGDCLGLLPEVEDKSVNLVLCDLPYEITQNTWDSLIPLDLLWSQYLRIIKNDGAIVLTAKEPFTSVLILNDTPHFRYRWTWDKVNRITGFLDAKNRPLRVSEDICIFSLNSCKYNPQMGQGKPYKAYHGKPTKNYGKHKEMETVSDGDRYPTDILRIKADNRGDEGRVHPTQKPVALFEYLIKTYTSEGDTVHDSCLGSGTTLAACRRTNRNCIGFEISDEWEHLYPNRCLKHTPTLQSYFDDADDQ